jgi:hypothetical protein
MSDVDQYALSVAHHAIANSSLARIQSYLERDRTYASMPADELQKNFVIVYREWPQTRRTRP